MPPVVATPTLLVDPGFIWIAPIGTTEPTTAVTAGIISDTVAAAWIPFGATTEGSTFSYNTTVEPIMVAELFDPVQYATTERAGNIAFNLAHWSLSNYRRAMNGGIAAIAPTGGAGLELATLEPPDPGAEVRAMILWQSTDNTVRILMRRTIQGGEVASAFQRAPSVAAIPCTFNMEMPVGGTKPWKMWQAGITRG